MSAPDLLIRRLRGSIYTVEAADRIEADAAELSRLRADLERATRERDEWAAKWQAERKKYAELRFPGMTGTVRAMVAAPAPAADTARDALRYRWLNGPGSEWEPFDSSWLARVDLYGQTPADMDAYIDAALAGADAQAGAQQTEGGA